MVAARTDRIGCLTEGLVHELPIDSVRSSKVIPTKRARHFLRSDNRPGGGVKNGMTEMEGARHRSLHRDRVPRMIVGEVRIGAQGLGRATDPRVGGVPPCTIRTGNRMNSNSAVFGIQTTTNQTKYSINFKNLQEKTRDHILNHARSKCPCCKPLLGRRRSGATHDAPKPVTCCERGRGNCRCRLRRSPPDPTAEMAGEPHVLSGRTDGS